MCLAVCPQIRQPCWLKARGEWRHRLKNKEESMAIRSKQSIAVLCSVALAAALAAPEVSAQGSYPNRAVRMVVPSSVGSGVDLGARLITPPLSERLGQQVVVDKRAGAGTM